MSLLLTVWDLAVVDRVGQAVLLTVWDLAVVVDRVKWQVRLK